MIDINTGISIIMNKWLQVKHNEVIHFVTDENHIRECEAFVDWANSSDIFLKTSILPSAQVQKGEIFEKMASSFVNDDVIIGACDHSFITTGAVQNAVKKGSRFLSLPLSCNDGSSLLERDFVTMDIKEASSMGKKIVDALNKANDIHITTKLGTDLYLTKNNRTAKYFCGECNRKSTIASSSFEVFLAPNEGKAQGSIVMDGAVGYIGKINSQTKLTVKDGFIIDIQETKDGLRLKEFMDSFNDTNIYSIGELGIGLNQKSKCDGICYIEDESTYSTFHIGMGRNFSLGGKQDAKGHFDIIVHKPNIYADDKLIMENGLLVI